MRKQKAWMGTVALVFLLVVAVGLGYALGKNVIEQVRNAQIADSKIVVYEGPKSLKDATKEDLESTSENLRDFSLMHCMDTQIAVNGYDLYVYDTNVNHTHKWVSNYMPPIARTPITYFDFEGRAQITVRVPETELDHVEVKPSSYGIRPIVDKKDHSVTFTVTRPDAYTLEFNHKAERAVHIFANPLEKNAPKEGEDGVVYIGPGEWDIDMINLEENTTLYIAGGAVVHGMVSGNHVNNVKVMGRGILDGSKNAGWMGKAAMIPMNFNGCSNVQVQDILLLNSNAWVFNGYETNDAVVDNIKIISPRPNGDGITLQSCENFLVKNSFVRSWDDSLVVKNYGKNSKNITFENMQIWTDLAQSMEVGYETNKGQKENASISDVTFQHITVLNNFHKPVISIHNVDDALVENITFSDITVENARMGSGDANENDQLIDIGIVENSNWSSTKKRGQIRNVVIDGVKVLSGKFPPSRIKGFDETHTVEGVAIRNLTILDKKIKTAAEGKFEIDETTTKNITIR